MPSPGIAGGAVAVVLAHIGHCTSTIRIGAGGIMLPNHNPFVIAEQFGTLDGAVSGAGRPRPRTARPAPRRSSRRRCARTCTARPNTFPQDVVELRALSTGDVELPIAATPGLGPQVQLWMLGSSLFGAQLAAQLGLPYAFASHFAPDHLDAALEAYRAQFRPSAALDEPHAMAAMTVICGDSDEEAELLASSQDQAFVRLRSGDPGSLPPPIAGLSPLAARIRAGDARAAVGGPRGRLAGNRGEPHRPVRRAHPRRRNHRFGRDLRSRRREAFARVDDEAVSEHGLKRAGKVVSNVTKGAAGMAASERRRRQQALEAANGALLRRCASGWPIRCCRGMRRCARSGLTRRPSSCSRPPLARGVKAGHRSCFRTAPGSRFMRIAVVNDDMPFLVDSIAGAIAAEGLTIDSCWSIRSFRSGATAPATAHAIPQTAATARESMIYLETARIDAKERRTLGDGARGRRSPMCGTAVADWPGMPRRDGGGRRQPRTSPKARRCCAGCASGMLTLLGHVTRRRDGSQQRPARHLPQERARQLLADDSYARAFAWFDAAKARRGPPLIVKANRLSKVHRRRSARLVLRAA